MLMSNLKSLTLISSRDFTLFLSPFIFTIKRSIRSSQASERTSSLTSPSRALCKIKKERDLSQSLFTIMVSCFCCLIDLFHQLLVKEWWYAMSDTRALSEVTTRLKSQRCASQQELSSTKMKTLSVAIRSHRSIQWTTLVASMLIESWLKISSTLWKMTMCTTSSVLTQTQVIDLLRLLNKPKLFSFFLGSHQESWSMNRLKWER